MFDRSFLNNKQTISKLTGISGETSEKPESLPSGGSMEFKFSLAHLTILKTTPVELARIAAVCGYDYVSIRQIYMGVPGEERYALYDDPDMKAEVKAIFRDTGLKLSDIELARVLDNMDVSAYEKAFELARELGGSHVLSSIWTENKPYYIEKFGEICDLAKKYDLTVDLEYVPIAGVRTLAQAMEVLRAVNRDNAGLMVDTHHFQRARDKYEDLRAVPDKYFHFAHLCDATGEIPAERDELVRIMREERLYAGEGGIDIAAILNCMPPMTYSIELPNAARVAELGQQGHAKRCLETAKEYCEKYVSGR
jgi:sugar phosphate isomerase/epimerase